MRPCWWNLVLIGVTDHEAARDFSNGPQRREAALDHRMRLQQEGAVRSRRLYGWGRDMVRPIVMGCLPREGYMTMGVGNIVALVCIVISVVFAVVTNQATNAVWWALLAIFAVLWWDARAPWGRP
jgi:hypothetical protein